ncbi:MAG TPA: acetate--CoA ligase family protein, partial [Gammaproteobacteria bacterium]|nr:acetate--CoA ligase family protein [Gammaproteobacteria bacterium]
MSVRNLESLFEPQSVAVIGASNRQGSVGATVMRNLLAGGFRGPVIPVNPKYRTVADVAAYSSIAKMPATPDLAIICTPPRTLPGLMDELGMRGTRAAIVLTAGLSDESISDGRTVQQAMLDAARPNLLRILGPNCIGLMIPRIGLNASFAHDQPLTGKLAFITQSGALATAVLDWSKSRGIGFSHFVSMGDSADVDFGDVLDYLGGQAGTRGILLYVEAIKHARKFMSAARAAARNKPVVVIKAGRVAESAKAAASHTGALAGADEVYDAAIRRAGMLRVDTIEDLFDAVETLARVPAFDGDRLTILTNGGGPGVMATDSLIRAGGMLGSLSKEVITGLDRVLPRNWSRSNPVDIIGDASAERYLAAIEILIDAPDTDALLILHSPTALASSAGIAASIAPVLARKQRAIFTCWLGGDGAREAKQIFYQHGLAIFDTPEDGARAFMQVVDFRRNQRLLAETPPSLPDEISPDTELATRIISKAISEEREILTEPEAKAVLAAYEIPIVETIIAGNSEQAVKAAKSLGLPVAVKILSRQISHKSDVGGVMLNVETVDQVHAVCTEMLARVEKLAPEAEVDGFTVQPMARRPGARELIAGVATDPVFGPVILFGQGGTAVEIIADRAIALPPLNLSLARDLVSRTRISSLLESYRDQPGADMESICLTLVKLSHLIAELPEVVELDINPLFADADGVIAIDARIRVCATSDRGSARFAIRPYPRELEEQIEFNGRRILLRPIRPEDEPIHQRFFTRLSTEDIRFRFFGVVKALEHSQIARYTQIDYDREMAFIAIGEDAAGEPETLGVVRAITDPDNQH